MYLNAYMYIHVYMCKCVHMCACGGQRILSILVLETGSHIGLGIVAVTDISLITMPSYLPVSTPATLELQARATTLTYFMCITYFMGIEFRFLNLYDKHFISLPISPA